MQIEGSGPHSSSHAEPAPCSPHLPVDILRMVLEKLLPPASAEAPDDYSLLKSYSAFSLVNKSFLEAARSTPLRVTLEDRRVLPRAGRAWLCHNTLAEVHFNADFPTERVITSPDFLARSAPVLQKLWGVQVPHHRYRSLPMRHFTALRSLELNAEAVALNEGRAHTFDVRHLTDLTQLTQLSLQQFNAVASLPRLPPNLELLSLHVFYLERFSLPTQLTCLRELTLSSRALEVDLLALCRQVKEKLYLEAPVLGLQPPAAAPRQALGEAAATAVGGPAAPAGAAAAGVPPEAGPAAAAAGAAAPAVLAPLAAWDLGVPVLVGQAMLEGRAGFLELFTRRVESVDKGGHIVNSLDVLDLVQQLQADNFRSFGCFCNPDDVEDDEELDLWEGLRATLLRHEPGKPQELCFTFELDPTQQAYLMEPSTQVSRLALEAVAPDAVVHVVGSDAFGEASGETLRQLQGPDIAAELRLHRFSRLEELDCFLPSLGLLEHLPPSLLRLFLCAVGSEHEQLEQPGEEGLLVWPAFSAQRLAQACPRLEHLSLSHFAQADLVDLPPSVTQLLIENLEPGPPERATGLQPVSFTLPPELPPSGTRVLKLQFVPAESHVIEHPVVELEQLMRSSEAGVLASEASQGPEHHISYPVTLYIRAKQDTLDEVMRAVTASPLQSIAFNARRVVFQGASGASVSSYQMQKFIKQRWAHAWRVVPGEAVDWESDVMFEDMDPEERAALMAGGEHSEAFELRRV